MNHYKLTFAVILSLLLPSLLMAKEPVTKDGSIEIKPGDSFIVEFDKSGDKLINPRVVEKIANGIYVFFQAASTFGDEAAAPKKPNSLLTFMMGESPNHTILLVQKHVKGTLKYDCEVRRVGKNLMDKRNNFPIEQTFPMLEQYPEKLDLIVLKNFTTK